MTLPTPGALVTFRHADPRTGALLFRVEARVITPAEGAVLVERSGARTREVLTGRQLATLRPRTR